MPVVVVCVAVAVVVFATTLVVRRRVRGRLPGRWFWAACAIGVAAITVGSLVDVSGVLLSIPAVAAAAAVIVRGRWIVGDLGTYLIVVGAGTGLAYLITAIVDPATGSYNDQAALMLLALGAVVCLAGIVASVPALRRTRERT